MLGEYVVYVSLSYSSVLEKQTVQTAIFFFTDNSGFVNTRAVRRAIVAAFPVPLSIYVSNERMSVMLAPRYLNLETQSSSYCRC